MHQAHAFLAQGGFDSVPSVLKRIRTEGIQIENNPDVFVRSYSAFLMEDARELRERASLRAIGNHGRIFVIFAPTIPPDAQNVLLKTLEEPPAGARFYIIVPSPETLLSTLRSRMQMLDLQHDGDRISIIDVKMFIASPTQKRLDMLKPLLEKDDDPEKPRGFGAGRRDLASTLSFIADLERELGTNLQKNALGLKAVYRARKYITDRGAIVKSLLEQVALLV